MVALSADPEFVCFQPFGFLGQAQRLVREYPVRERPGTVPGVVRVLLAPPLAPFAAPRSGTAIGRG